MRLTIGGWLFAVTAWLAIIGLAAWCMTRLLRRSQP